MKLPSQQLLLAILHYDPETGLLTWRPRPIAMFVERKSQTAAQSAAAWNAKNAGRPALNCLAGHGYLRGSLLGHYVYAHRAIWKMMTGDDADVIDHGNGNKADNRWANLASGGHLDNARNTSLRSDNSSGHPGVGWNAKAGKWVARISLHGRNVFIGQYTTKDLAIVARQEAQTAHGFHPNHGRAQ